MNKGLKNTLVISTIVGIAFLIAAFCFGMFNKSEWISANQKIREANGMYKESVLVNETTSEEINNISVQAVDRDIVLVKSETNEIGVTYYSNFEKEFTYSVENGNLTIVQHSKKYIFMLFGYIFDSQEQRTIKVSVPEKTYDSINLKSVSGDVNYSGINSTTLVFKSTSGEVVVNNAIAQEISSSSTSGGAKLNNLTAENLKVTNTSGSILLNKVNVANNLTIKNTSGKIQVKDGELNVVDVKNVSGSNEINATKFVSATLKSTSGSNRVLNSAESSETTSFTTSSVSGNTYINNAKKGKNYNNIIENAKQTIVSDTTSGSFHFTNA